MNFCPECGSRLEEKTICDCGYNIETGERKKEIKSKPQKTEVMSPDLDTMFKERKKKMIPLKELKKVKLDNGKLLNISFGSSGGMMGSYYNYSLSIKDKIITATTQEWHHGDRVTKTYKVKDSVIKEMSKIIEENNMSYWSKLELDKTFIAYDAPSSYMSLTYEKNSYNISMNLLMNDEEIKIINDLRELFMNELNDKNMISENVQKGQEFNILGMMQPTVAGVNILKSTFCPECGSPIEKDQLECTACGYKRR